MEVDHLLDVLKVLELLLVLRGLLLLAKEIPQVDVENEDDLPDRDKRSVERLLDGLEASLLDMVVETSELLSHLRVIIRVQKEIDDHVAD